MIELFGHLYAPDDRGLSTVTIDGGTIAAIRPGAIQPAASFGGPSARILPGLIDMQINGAFGDDFADPSADVAEICRRLTRFGVTGFVPTIVTSAPDLYAPALANLRRSQRPGEARVLGVHIEGPYISPKHPGTHDPALLRRPSVDEAARWLDEGNVRWLTLAPELPGALELISFLVQRGVRVSMGHTDATWAEAAAAADAGATLATHIFNAMRPLRHREPGVAGFVMASELTAGFIADGNHVAFEMLRLLARVKAPDELVLVTDALAGLGMPPGRYMVAGREYVSDGTCGRLPDGTLSGSLLPLNLALRNLVEFVGLDVATAVRLASVNPAKALGLDGSMGRLEVGGPADAVVVDENWQPLVTIAGGSVAYVADVAVGAEPVR